MDSNLSRDLVLSLLRKGNNGNQILQILESLTKSNDNEDASQGTLNPIQF